MRKRKYTLESLSPVVQQAKSYSELLSILGLKQTGGNHRLITMRIKEYGISVSHFKGHGWSRGETKETHRSIWKQSLKVRTPHEKVFCKNSGFNSSRLYDRLIELGWENKCSECELTTWLNRPLRLHVDHINGDPSDNCLKNLRFLCPNCHQQTETWGCKKNGTVAQLEEGSTFRAC